MDDSILVSVKKDIGAFVDPDEDAFDSSLVRYINTVFGILNQLGVGPSNGYKITGADNVWSEFTDDETILEMVKTLMSERVSLMFDPPSSSFVAESKKAIIDELEWRLNVAVDPSMQD